MNPLADSVKPWLWYTLGPATVDKIDHTLLAGADGVRLTLSYATPELHIRRARAVAARAASLGRTAYTIADLPGEKFRLDSFSGETLQVEAGNRIRLGPPGKFDVQAPIPLLPVQSERFLSFASPGAKVIVGDGGVELQVVAVGDVLDCDVSNGGTIENNRGLTIVGAAHSPRSLVAGDLEKLRLLAESNAFSAVALSFVSDPADLRIAREIVSTAERPVALVAKIETAAGVERIDEICAAADIVMAARGDLALAIGPPLLYAAVAHIGAAAATGSVPWVLATQLLEGLDYSGFPTRAELTDVVGWLAYGASGAMLSRETVFGRRPLDSIKLLRSLLDAPRNWSET